MMNHDAPKTSSTPTSPPGPEALGGAPHWLGLIGPLEALEHIEWVATPSGMDALELARELRAELRIMEMRGPSSGAGLMGGYFSHNLAALVVAMAPESPELEAARTSAAGVLAAAAEPVLRAAAGVDPEDLLIALARLEGALLREPGAGDEVLLEEGKRATASPHAGDRVLAAHARLVAACAQGRDKGLRAAAMRYAEDALSELGTYLARHPFHEAVARTRIDLLSLRVRRATGATRDDAFRSVRTALREYEARFGRGARLAALELAALVDRLVGDDNPPAAAVRDAVAGLKTAAEGGIVPASEALAAFRTLERGGHLKADALTHIAQGFGAWSERSSGEVADSLRRARTRALTLAGDQQSLLADAIELIQRNPKDRRATSTVAQAIVDALKQRAPVPEISPELFAAVVAELPYALSASWDEGELLLWLQHVEAALGEEVAAEHAQKNLLSTREARRHAKLLLRALNLLEQVGQAERALDWAETAALELEHPELRLWAAERLMHHPEMLARAELLLRPVAAGDSEWAARAKSLREQIAANPQFAESQRRELLDFEAQIGVSKQRRLRLRIKFLGDDFALADVADHKAPASYGHPHLRVMIKRSDLPSYLGLEELRKGQDLFGPVRGDDDKRGGKKSSLRVYWVEDGNTVDPGWSDAEREARAMAIERTFGLNSGAAIALEVVRAHQKAQGCWVRLIPPAGAAPFPVELRIGSADFGKSAPNQPPSAGTRLFAPVDSEPSPERGPGERRFRVRGPVQIDESKKQESGEGRNRRGAKPRADREQPDEGAESLPPPNSAGSQGPEGA